MRAYIDTVRSFGATPPGEEPAQSAEAAEAGNAASDAEQRQSTRLTLEDGVATLRLDRPTRMNAFDFHMYREVIDTLHAMAKDSVRRSQAMLAPVAATTARFPALLRPRTTPAPFWSPLP